ncbi:MAG TPA: hypothetical protein VJ963_06120 [Bacteroidales bacterium]|nr:hypothetical protein [Bacteroidales bacterium]
MKKRTILIIIAVTFLLVSSCVKETYNIDKLSDYNSLSPTYAISAVKGDVSLLDMLEAGDTVTYGSDNFMTLVFKQDSVITLQSSDFLAKGPLTAEIEPGDFDLGMQDILNHITGDIYFSNPSLTFTYSNAFAAPLEMDVYITGIKGSDSLHLDPIVFTPAGSGVAGQQEAGSYTIDNTNSSLPDLISFLPEKIHYSGDAYLLPPPKSGGGTGEKLETENLTGSIELDIPMQLRMNNLQFADTTDNFLKSDDNGDAINPEDFDLLRVDISADNGFPLGISLSMSLYDSQAQKVLKTIDATDLLSPAAVDSEGKSSSSTQTNTTIELTNDFFSSVNKADNIIFTFKMSTSGGGSQDVKIYSDYRINFKASLVIKPGINLN